MTEKILIKASRKDDSGIVVHEMNLPLGEEETKELVLYRKIWGGVAWPTEYSPAYACFIGQRYLEENRYEQTRTQEPLFFLSECQSDALTLEDFLQRITDETARLCGDKLYANLGQWSEQSEQKGDGKFSGYVTSFRRYLSDNKVPYVTLEGAPYVDNYLYTVQIINDFKKQEKLHVPENTTAFDQLTRIKKSDIQDNPEQHYFAVEALRHVVAAFAKYRPGPSLSGFVPSRRKTYPQHRKAPGMR